MRISGSPTQLPCSRASCSSAASARLARAAGAASAAALATLALLLLGAAAAPAAEARTCDRVAAGGWKLNGPRKLVRRLRPGQVGCLHAGTYRRRQLVIRKPRITLRSYPGERATMKGRIVLAARRVTLSHLNLDGARGPACRGPGCFPGMDVLPSPTLNGRGSRLLGNDITNGRGICVNVTRWRHRRPNRFRIERNRIHDCRPANNHIHGIYITTGRGGVVRDNVIYDNGDKGIVFYPNARDTLVESNTIDGNRTGVHFGGGTDDASSGNVVRRNVMSFPMRRDGLPARFNVEHYWPGPIGRGNVVRGNCLYTASRDEYFSGRPRRSGVVPEPVGVRVSRSLVRNPRYADRANGDFTLRPGSPCAGMGARAPVATADGWCGEVEPPGARGALYRGAWPASRRSCFGPKP